MNEATNGHPVVVIGAGPVGLAAAARLVERGLTPLVLEKGPSVGSSLRAWAHVRVFTSWRFNIDDAAGALLEADGWTAPDPEVLPTGGELVRDYLEPLAAHPAIAPHLVLEARVMAISRVGLDKMRSSGRERAPFVVSWVDVSGAEQRTLASAVLDCSGTWDLPNPMGVDGLPVPGEVAACDRIAYGIPDVIGAERALYAGGHVLVIGSGHSAINAALDLLALQQDVASTRVTWAIRSDGLGRLAGGGAADRLAERGALGTAAQRAIETGRVELVQSFAAERIERSAAGLIVHGHAGTEPVVLSVDRIVVATGFRPRHDLLRELRVVLDPAIEAPPALAPLIDPNFHSCGTVRPHGAAELAHPEQGFYIVGSKAYGRAPTFLMATGYEQVRSVVAEIAGDHATARDVRLVLPETGVCSSAPRTAEDTGCCGGPAGAGVDACCVADAEAKADGHDGCGCGAADTVVDRPAKTSHAACCGAAA